ncbi:carbon-nitrogen hydrolase family protein [Rhodobacteraceae bacterium N5(2021)]|uniref:Carbon-nitrogen hydrolase family protein n=2 Tax=Gymnodinialimonas phycosphaerae TaxID=2841589 RepID=A0A975YI36_9RHOB|nr:carbon-nitrogen hydrolase family protein [Gymnodinialimonas phycosphaerae]MBY4893464.1 carbon-nitrogen hydrolase family protein [Gymnodinialimonas phycosphaerae]
MGQMCSGDTHADNIATVTALAAEAAGQGAKVLALPEVAGLMNANRKVALTQVSQACDDPFIAACRNLAAKHGLWIHTGSTPVTAPDGRFLNHSTLIDADGEIKAEYDKVHLFDVQIEGQAPIGESKRYAPGNALVMAETPWGGFGLTICYDLRFPYLYRTLGQAGARVIFIPSAFTVATGRAHWEILLRARAIETGAFVIAAAQSGTHADGRETYGHGLAVDPWGRVLADMGEGAPKVALVDLDLSLVDKARAQIPALTTGRDVPLRRV